MLEGVDDQPTVAWRPGDEPDERVLDGRYVLGARLGGGAVAEVFRAEDERLARPVAVKIFRGDAADELQRHEAEMRTLASLEHPNLVSVYDAGTTEDTAQPYLVMQLIDGHTLADELREGALPAERTARYGAALADALAYVHAQGFVHRDVKPANVLVANDGRVHLADFGIARLVDSAHTTRAGEVVGTPAYFAPEQVAGEPVGAAVDIYSLGMVLLECLTGERSFEGTTMEVAVARLARDPDVPEHLPAGWRRLLRAMTARDPAHRPAATQVAEALRAVAAEGGDQTVVLTPPPSATTVLPAATTVMPATTAAGETVIRRTPAAPPRRRFNPAVLVVALLVAVAVAIAIGVAVARNQNDTPASYKPGLPTLHQPLEKDMQDLEKLVRR
ncbi:MAG: eukaryotic-like serine/threonine-protein kinase [Frankiaceae bacterium]|jgi:serine/threonine protein kinase|nr:eukaryotic-like serine/threonine-protein kinase [Frankiaceae bacterium]